jgi:hypothetical protein
LASEEAEESCDDAHGPYDRRSFAGVSTGSQKGRRQIIAAEVPLRKRAIVGAPTSPLSRTPPTTPNLDVERTKGHEKNLFNGKRE